MSNAMRPILASLALSLPVAAPAIADVTLEDQRLFLAPPAPWPVLGWNLEVGDGDGDGEIDIALADEQVNLMGAGWVLFGPDFTSVVPLPTPPGLTLFGGGVWRFTDLNADGFDDVLCSAPWSDVGGMSKVGRVFVFYGPTFQTMTEVPVPGGGASDLTFGLGGAVHDYTGDGWVDLIIGSPGAVLSSVTLAGRIDVYSGASGFAGPPVATFMPPNPSAQRIWGNGLEVADHDGDGTIDLGTTEYQNGPSGLRWLGGFDPNDTAFIQPPGIVSTLGYVSRILVVDVDEDGAADVVTGAPESGSGKVVRMSGPTFTSTQFLLPPDLSTAADFGQGVDIGDVDRDGNLDIVAGGPKDDLGLKNDAGRVSIFFGPSFLARQDLWGEFAKSELGYGTKFVDLDGDGFSELLVGAGKEWGGGALHLYRHRTLRVVGPDTVSLTSGGTATLKIEDGRLSKQRPYLILSSTSGSSPGFSFPYGSGAVDVPLNWDAFTTLALPLANTPLFAGFTGTLSTPGEATATLTVPPGAGAPSLAGTTLTFCALIADAAGAPARATHADEVTLTP